MTHRILVVEDSPTQAEALRALLEGAGYAIAVAASGEEALRQLPRFEPHLVVSDIMMPGIDGYELCRRLKTEVGRASLPVMLLTSLSDPLDIIRGLEAGADNFLTKPYRPEHLLERVRHVLGNRNLRRASKVELGVAVSFLDRTFRITADKEQILDLLISTFEDAVLQNRELRQRELELETARLELARYVGTLEERLQGVLRSVPDLLFSTSPDGKQIHYVSPASGAILDCSPEALMAEPALWEQAVHPEDRPSVREARRRAVEGRRPQRVDHRRQTAEQPTRWVRIDFVPILDASGRVVRIDGSARDMTRERSLERQLQLAQKMEAVGTLAGGIAHDFNNLLAAMKGTIDLLILESAVGSAAPRELGELSELIDRAAELTRQLLTFGRRQPLQPRLVDLNGLVDGVVRLIRRILGEDIRLSLLLMRDAVSVSADPGQLEQVLWNLCANARDAMPDGGELKIASEVVTLDEEFVAAHPWARPGEYARLTVSDTGVGMDAATQARIFEPFFTTKEVGRGTGLGLAVVYGIIQQHDGLVHVYSEPGRGTVFRIYLPLHREAVPAVPELGLADVPRGSGLVLLAEDDEGLRITGRRLLERLGYEVIVVPDGRQALEHLARASRRPDLVILDAVMPVMGGMAALREIRARYPALRALLTTGYTPGTPQMKELDTASAPILRKPYGIRELARTVRQALDLPARETEP